MSRSRSNEKRPRLNASKIHLDVVRTYVTHYCADFSWQSKALGFIRARQFPALLELAKVVNATAMTEASSAVTPTEYGSREAFLLARQFGALILKYQYPAGLIPGVDPEARAYEDFFAAERRNRRLNILFRAYRERGLERHWSIPLIRKIFTRVLGRKPFLERIFDLCDFSGGSSVNTKGNSTHMAAKLFRGNISGTTSVSPYFREALWRNDHYRSFFLDYGPLRPDGTRIPCLDYDAFVEKVESRSETVDYNILTAVLKNAFTMRVIAMESEKTNFLQKGLDQFMREKLARKLKIHLEDQETNQVLAWRGSVSEEVDPYVTLDVKGASNGTGYEFVKSVSPPSWFKLFDELRSPNYSVKGVKHPYHMLCSMGNGFCFPLESLIFASVCIAAAQHSGVRPDYRVYGDDIVVRRSLALIVVEILRVIGYQMNLEKSFIFGQFRESCGADWYGGLGVTPVYYRDPVSTTSALYQLHNAFHQYPLVQEMLRNMVSNPHVVSDTPMYAWVTNQAFRVSHDLAMSSPRVSWNRETHSWNYSLLTSVPVADEEWESEVPLHMVPTLAFSAVLRGGQSAEEPFHLRKTVRLVTTRG